MISNTLKQLDDENTTIYIKTVCIETFVLYFYRNKITLQPKNNDQ